MKKHSLKARLLQNSGEPQGSPTEHWIMSQAGQFQPSLSSDSPDSCGRVPPPCTLVS